MQQPKHDWLAVPLPVLQASGKGSNICKRRLLGQEAADLQIGMNPRFQTAEQLEHEAIAKDDGTVGLLGLLHNRFQIRPLGAPNFTKWPKRHGSKVTSFASELSPSRDRIDQDTGKTLVPQRTV